MIAFPKPKRIEVVTGSSRFRGTCRELEQILQRYTLSFERIPSKLRGSKAIYAFQNKEPKYSLALSYLDGELSRAANFDLAFFVVSYSKQLNKKVAQEFQRKTSLRLSTAPDSLDDHITEILEGVKRIFGISEYSEHVF